MSSSHIALTTDPIDLDFIRTFVSHPHAGGIVLFVGTTRSWTINQNQPGLQGKATEFLYYEAHESMARQQLSDLASQAMNQWSLLSVAIVHRMGKVLPQEASIALAVSSPHRAQAFAAAEWIIDQIKRDVAIWKQENYKCSTSEWVHSDDAYISQCPPIDVPQTFPPHG